MITFIILTIIALILAAVTAFVLAIGGTAFVLVFGDVIVFALIMVWIIKKLIKR